jgi:SAM-dependent methyltransferase
MADSVSRASEEQAELWNGAAGRAWADEQALLDHLFEPFERALVDAALAGPTHHVLDVGCGAGATTLAVARALGPTGRCTGVDVSEVLIAAARRRAARDGVSLRFIRADAQDYPFERASVDTIVSRFGVMFFADPVRAFANLRRAARDGAALRVIAWRSPDENPFMTTAERAAAPLLPNLPARHPAAPGQFAFADRDRVAGILERGGWSAIDIRPIDVVCRLPGAALPRYVARMGPLARVLPDLDAQTRQRVLETACAAFAPYVHGGEIRFTAACWMIGATTGSA